MVFPERLRLIAQGYVLQYPQRVSKLILGVTVSDGSFFTAARRNLYARGNAEQIAWGEKILAGQFTSDAELKQFCIAMVPLYSNKAKKEGINIQAFDKVILSYQAINNGFSDFMQTVNYTPELHKITCPTLLFGGRDDWIVDPECIEKIAAEIPQVQLKMFENSGHLVAVDAHEEYITMLREFIQS